MLLLLCVDEVDRLKHQNHEELIQKCFVFLERRQRKWLNQRKLSTNHVFKRLFRFFTLDLKVRLIEAFPVKAELHNVAGYVYRFKRAAGGYAQFLNSVAFQLVHKCHQNCSSYHGLEVREDNLFWPFSVLIRRSFSVTSLLAVFTSFFTSLFTSFFTSFCTSFFTSFLTSVLTSFLMSFFTSCCASLFTSFLALFWTLSTSSYVSFLAFYSVGLTLFFSVPFHVSDNNEITRPTGQDEARSMVQHIPHVQHVQHVPHVQHVQHDQQDIEDSNKYNNKSGDEVPITIYISSSLILSLIIYMLLLQYGISPNPGPEKAKKSNLSFITYNCRGLMDGRKLRRVLAKVGPLVDKNCIVALQETHKIDDRLLKLYWRHNFIRNCNHSNKKGVVLLFNNEFKVNKFETDKDDRYIIVELENSFVNLIVCNVYFPNDHVEASSFTENFYTKLLEYQYIFPEAFTVILGDFNVCMEKKDSVNRIGTQQELDLVKTLKANNKTCDLLDTYRILETEEGYTWSRGNLFSRLDYIFVSSSMTNKLVKTKVDWCFDKSDHAALFVISFLTRNLQGDLVSLN